PPQAVCDHRGASKLPRAEYGREHRRVRRTLLAVGAVRRVRLVGVRLQAMRPLAQGELDEIVETTRSSWEQMRGGRLLLTGGTGFFGRWLVESFVHANARLRLGARVVVLSRRARSLATEAAHVAGDPAVTLHDGDVCVDLKLAGAFSHVVHTATAASASLNEESPDVMATTIVSGTCHALAAARASGARRFLLASSGAVYGRQPPALALVGE